MNKQTSTTLIEQLRASPGACAGRLHYYYGSSFILSCTILGLPNMCAPRAKCPKLETDTGNADKMCENICSFPDEILLRIFRNLSVDARLTSELVCRRWHQLMFYNDIECLMFYFEGQKLHPPVQRSTKVLNAFVKKQQAAGMQLDAIKIATKPQLWHPAHGSLSDSHEIGQLATYIIEDFNTNYLIELDFGHHVFSDLNMILPLIEKSFPNLTKLRVGIETDCMGDLVEYTGGDQLHADFQNNFPKLIDLSCENWVPARVPDTLTRLKIIFEKCNCSDELNDIGKNLIYLKLHNVYLDEEYIHLYNQPLLEMNALPLKQLVLSRSFPFYDLDGDAVDDYMESQSNNKVAATYADILLKSKQLFPELQTLKLSNVKLSGEFMDQVAHISHVDKLTIKGGVWTNDQIVTHLFMEKYASNRVKCLRLSQVNRDYPSIIDLGAGNFISLEPCAQMGYILETAGKSFHNLEYLHLKNCSLDGSNAGFTALLKSAANLKRIKFGMIYDLGGEYLECLVNAKDMLNSVQCVECDKLYQGDAAVALATTIQKLQVTKRGTVLTVYFEKILELIDIPDAAMSVLHEFGIIFKCQ